MKVANLTVGAHYLEFLCRNPTVQFPLTATSSTWVGRGEVIDQERSLLMVMPRCLLALVLFFPVFAYPYGGSSWLS